eukprot:scaffold91217_cov69-Cyclotella_meneghiniana.AAC.8
MTDTKKFVNRASEAALTATAFAHTSARRIVDTIASAGLPPDDRHSRSNKPNHDSFGFLDNMCGPILNNFKTMDPEETDDLTAEPHQGTRRGSGGRSSRRPHGSFDYDDETNVTDVTSYDEEDETYDGQGDKKQRGGDRNRRGQDRKPSRGSEEMDEMPDDTDTEFSSVYPKDKVEGKKDGKDKKKRDSSRKPEQDTDTITTGLASTVVLSQPLASGFAKRCYFTKSGIGRTTQHYEGLTLTGNTVLMLASAMKLKGCPTICDEDLRRVEQTYPNQFSRLPDELLLSSGWRRISKYCHFSHKPLPDGVPFFHSRRRCHPNGGFYFLLCSAVGMTRLMDVEPLNRDALAVLQTDYPVPCEKAPANLIEDPDEWTLVNKFCFFSGGPINVEEDVYYRAELGGTEIYMLAFLSPSLSPQELYRLKPSKAGKPEDNEPLKSVAAVEEIESVYDLTERDFDDLKLYHLGPCRALPPYLLHPEAWTKVLPPHFVAARDQAMIKAMEYEKHLPPSSQPSPSTSRGVQDNSNAMTGNSEYVELGGRGRYNTGSRAPGMTPQGMGPPSMGHAFQSHYGGMAHMMHPPQHSLLPQQGAMPYHPQQQSMTSNDPQQQQMSFGGMAIEPDMSYYYGNPGPLQNGLPPGPSNFMSPQHQLMHPSPNRYGNNASLNHSALSDHPFDTTPPRNNLADPRWVGVQDEGAFGMNPVIANDQPDDEALATRGGSTAVYTGMNGGMMQTDESNAKNFNNYNGMEMETAPNDPQDDGQHDHNLMSLERREEYKRPDLSTKIGNQAPVIESWESETRTEGDSTYNSSTVTGSSITEQTNPNERNSRRALILQMAKARMKNVKAANTSDKAGVNTDETVAVSEQQDSMEDQAAHLELD